MFLRDKSQRISFIKCKIKTQQYDELEIDDTIFNKINLYIST